MYRLRHVFYWVSTVIIMACSSVEKEYETLERQLKEYVADKDARIGIAVIIDGCDTVQVNGRKEFPMLSVFKFPLALAVAAYCDNHDILFSDSIPIIANEIKINTWSPLREKYGITDLRLSISELLSFSLKESDNNACDILLRLLGGPEEVNRFITESGFPEILVSVSEDDMHRDIYMSYLNRTTPIEMARLLERFNTVIRHTSDKYQQIAELMESCATGTDRLARPLLSTNVVIGHKTGTGDINSQKRIIAVNDCGYVNLSDNRHYAIAVFIADSAYDLTESSHIIADISEIVFKFNRDFK